MVTLSKTRHLSEISFDKNVSLSKYQEAHNRGDTGLLPWGCELLIPIKTFFLTYDKESNFLSNPSLPGKSPILLLRVLFWKRADLFLPLNGVFLGLENQTLSPFKSEASVNLKNSFWVVCIFKGFCAVWRSYSNFKKPILDKICSPLSARKLIQLGQAFTQINRNGKFRRNRLNYG